MNLGDLCSYTFYLLLNLSTYSILLSINDNYYKDHSIIYHICQIFFSISAYILLITTKNNPGRIENNTNNVELENIQNNDDDIEKIDDSYMKVSTSSSNISDTSKKLDIQTVNSNQNENTPINNKIKLKNNFEINLPINNCIKCNIQNLPLRSHHCSRCKMCIRSYDHHCGMIGGCVGEENHFKFLLFLFTQTVALLIGVISIFQSIANLLSKNNDNYLIVPPFTYLILFILIFFCVFCISLLCFHVYLILTNQSTFELYYPQKCQYLEIFKKERKRILNERGIVLKANFSFHPFDLGFIENFKCLFKRV